MNESVINSNSFSMAGGSDLLFSCSVTFQFHHWKVTVKSQFSVIFQVKFLADNAIYVLEITPNIFKYVDTYKKKQLLVDAAAAPMMSGGMPRIKQNAAPT